MPNVRGGRYRLLALFERRSLRYLVTPVNLIWSCAREAWVRSQGHNQVFLNPYRSCYCAHLCACCPVDNYPESYAAVLRAFHPARVFEWGPGKNTRMALEAGAHVVSIEQNPRWMLAPRDGLEQRLVGLEDPAYVLCDPDADVYFVDSRWRAECIQSVARRARNPEHIVYLHDAQRKRYHWALRYYKYVRFLAVGNAVASNSPRILEI